MQNVPLDNNVVPTERPVPAHADGAGRLYLVSRLRAAAIAGVMLCLLTGCRHNDGDGKMIFRYNEAAGISTLDPAFAKDQAIIWGCTQLYNGLIELDSTLTPQPALAKRWSISDDGKTYTFILRDDVRFHRDACFGTADSTRRVVAADVKYSFDRILDPDVASPGRWIFDAVAADGFQAADDSTFVIHLKEPFAPFLGMLGMAYCSVVPHEVVEHYGNDFGRHPCGTGPFHFQLWKENVKLVLRRNDDYFEHDAEGVALPYLDAVAITFVVDKQTAFLEFMKGNLDFMNSLDASYKDELLTRTGQLKNHYAADIDMVSTPFLNTEYLGFLMDGADSPLKDRRIRQAVNYGIDRRKMMKYLRNNVGTPGCGGFIPTGLGISDSLAGYEYDPAKARRLLADAGHPNGKGLPPITLTTTAGYLDICKYLQQQLQLIGFDIKVDVTPPAALREQMAQGKCNWFRGSWIADYPDAENYLSLFYSTNRAPAGPNYTHFSDPHYDKLYQQARRCSDTDERKRLYQQMNQMVTEEAPVVVLYYDQILHFTHKNTIGLRSNALNALDLRHTKIIADGTK